MYVNVCQCMSYKLIQCLVLLEIYRDNFSLFTSECNTQFDYLKKKILNSNIALSQLIQGKQVLEMTESKVKKIKKTSNI